MNILEKVLQITETLQDLKNQIEDLRVNRHANQTRSSREQFQEMIRETFEPENIGTIIKTFDKAMHMIPEFNGIRLNIKAVISRAKLTAEPRKPLLYDVIAQELTGRTQSMMRIDTHQVYRNFMKN